jgi:hypothetical protein
MFRMDSDISVTHSRVLKFYVVTVSQMQAALLKLTFIWMQNNMVAVQNLYFDFG